MLVAVDVGPEGDAIGIHRAAAGERKNLKSSRIGENRAVPSHQPMESAEAADAFGARP